MTTQAQTTTANGNGAAAAGKMIQSNAAPNAKTIEKLAADFKRHEMHVRKLGEMEGKGTLAKVDFAIYMAEGAANKWFPVDKIEPLFKSFSNGSSQKAIGQDKKFGAESLANTVSTFKAFYDLGLKPYGLDVLVDVAKVAKLRNGPFGRAYKCVVAIKRKDRRLSVAELTDAADATTSRSLKAKLIAAADAVDKSTKAWRELETSDKLDKKAHWPVGAIVAAETYAKALRAEAKKL